MEKPKEERVLMKKIISVLLLVTCLVAALALPTTAAADPLAVKFQDQLQLLDHFYEFNAEYWVRIRRGLLRVPIQRIGLGGYLHLTEDFPDFQDYIEQISDEFRLLKEFHENGA